MSLASSPPDRSDAPVFVDGLGERSLAADAATGELLHILHLRPSLTRLPSFEFAVRERTARLMNFRHTYYARVRRVDRLPSSGTFAVVSDYVEGTRLSEILHVAYARRLQLDTSAALCLIRQLVHAAALLHENARDAAHGLIAPERLIVTPHARLVIVEHVLGSAIEQLQLNRERLWQEFRIAVPASAGVARFDHRADVTGLGMTALALVLGRPIGPEEFPHALPELIMQARGRSAPGQERPLSPAFRGWLARTLQLDLRQAFASAPEARTALEEVLAADPSCIPAPIALEAFLNQYMTMVLRPEAHAPAAVVPMPPAPAPAAAGPYVDDGGTASPVERESRGAPSTMPGDVADPVLPAVPSLDQLIPVDDLRVAQDASAAHERPADAPPSPAPAQNASAGFADFFDADVFPAALSDDRTADPVFQPPARRRRRRRRSRLSTSTAVWLLLGLGSAAVVGARLYTADAVEALPGTVLVQSNPPGVEVFIDGVSRGMTPASISVAAGPHILELRGRGVPRVIPLSVPAGGQVSQYLEFTDAPLAGILSVQSQPAGARVIVDGRLRGTAPLTLEDIAPGDHEVILETEHGSSRHVVSVLSGTTASLIAPVVADPAGPVSGWIALESPFTIEIREDGRLLGTSETERVMLAAGRHVLELVNEPLGFRQTRVVQVQPGKVTTLPLELPRGTVNLNATPWAEVWIGGTRVGETPIGNLELPIGPHEIVFRHPELGERRHAVSVTTAAPVRISVPMQ